MLRGDQWNIELQARDLALLRGLFESRVMTLAHAARLYFDGKAEMAKKRVQRLKETAFVRERPRRTYEPSVLFLTAKAFRTLADRGMLAHYPKVGLTHLEKRAQVSDLTLRHELAVMDVKAALVAAVNPRPTYEVVEFATWPLLCQFEATHAAPSGYGRTPVLLKPDGLIRLYERDADGTYEHAFYLEVDRSTESQDTLAKKVACYVDHYRSGGYAVRQGGQRTEYQDYPFRVLMVFRNAERRNNAAERLLTSHPPIHTQVWLTTFAEATANPLGAVWVRPVDYRDAVAGSSFDVARVDAAERLTYRRQPEREALAEARVVKQSLLVATSTVGNPTAQPLHRNG